MRVFQWPASLAALKPPIDWPARCAAVIPCLNEAGAIAGVVRGVRAHLPSVIVVDDGSCDDTAALARDAGAEVLRHESPRGKGAALRHGWEAARARGFDWALCLDGDGQHSPDDVPALLACAASSGARLVIGNRMDAPDAMPWVRRQVNRWMSRRLSRLAGREFPDSQCGFRLMQLEACAALPLRASHFEIESETLLAFAAAAEPIAFVPVRVIYRGGRSNIHPWRDTWRWLRWLRRWKSASKPAGTPAR